MFLKLYNLSPKDFSGSRAKEDFTTEILAAMLKAEPQFADDFYNLIQLPKDDYVVETQFPSDLSCQSPSCIIDLVLKGKTNLCFIENKVESDLGFEQLERYSKELDCNSYSGKFLRYCTKYQEDAPNMGGNFLHFTWHDVARLIKQKYLNNYYLNSFYDYLFHHGMANNYQLTEEKIQSAKFMQDTLKTFQHYLKACKGDFEGVFNSKSSEQTFTALQSNRIGFRIRTMLETNPRFKEVMYSIDMDTQLLNVHLYYHRDWLNRALFKKAEAHGFDIHDTNEGLAIHLFAPLSAFTVYEDPTRLIKEWYLESFHKLKDFIEGNKL